MDRECATCGGDVTDGRHYIYTCGQVSLWGCSDSAFRHDAAIALERLGANQASVRDVAVIRTMTPADILDSLRG